MRRIAQQDVEIGQTQFAAHDLGGAFGGVLGSCPRKALVLPRVLSSPCDSGQLVDLGVDEVYRVATDRWLHAESPFGDVQLIYCGKDLSTLRQWFQRREGSAD